MKYSYNWLKELSGTKKEIEEIADLFITHSFEVEGVEDLSKGLENVVIGEVLEVKKHPDADRLNVAKVKVKSQKLKVKSDEEVLQIVCGAPNLEVGQKVPVALVGAVLPDPHPNSLPKGKGNTKGFEIKKSKIRGVESNGMICAEDELGLGDNHEGIMVLSEDAPVGESFAKFMGLDDDIIDIDILPNRGHDCLSYRGVANEIRALENNRDDSVLLTHLPKGKDKLSVSIDTDKCNRYIGVKIDNIQIKESPAWLQARLRASDINPINNVVDITNYIMLETGQPLHAFDSKKVSKIAIRQATKKEKLVLLDKQELELDKKDIVITDGQNPIALAGVMGGLSSAVVEDTQSIILEAASFDAPTIRLTQRKYNLQTDAAYRFERNLDPNLAQVAAVRAIEMLEELVGGQIESIVDIYPKPVEPWTIKVSVQKVNKLLGTEIPVQEMVDILVRLGMQVENMDEKNIDAIVPTIRVDIKTQEDIIEEIGRMYGYNKIKPIPLMSNIQTPHRNEIRFFERILRDVFVYGGFDEVRGYSFYSRGDAQAIGLDDESHIVLMNPMNPDQTFMRRTLMPSLLNFVKKNFSYFERIQIFEIGRIYDPVEMNLPDEKLVLGGAVASKDSDGSQFFEMKGIIEVLLDRINIGKYYLDTNFDENVEHLPNLHPSRRAIIKMESGKIIGWFGEADKKTSKYFGLKKNRAVVCELDIEEIFTQVESENFFEALVKYPFVTRDISMKVGERVRVGDVERIIYVSGGDLIKDVDLFDLYVNKETGERSMAFHIVFGADEKTLEAKEVDEKVQDIITELEDMVDIEIRK